MKTFFQLFLCACLSLLGFFASAKTPAPRTLEAYVHKTCSKTCVDSKILLRSVKKNSKKHKVDYKVMLAIIKTESSFNPNARNGSSVGLTQVLLRYHRPKFKGGNVYGIDSNVAVGTQIYKDCSKARRGNVPQALRCYNGGGDRNYATKVMRAYDEINRLQIKES